MLIIYKSNSSTGKLKLYYNDSLGNVIGSSCELKEFVESNNPELVFAVNGRMNNKDKSPQGLFVEKGIVRKEVDARKEGFGNFYLKPNGGILFNQRWKRYRSKYELLQVRFIN